MVDMGKWWGYVPAAEEIRLFGFPERYWGCHAYYDLELPAGHRRRIIPIDKKTTHYGFSDKLQDADAQSDFVAWINGTVLHTARQTKFTAATDGDGNENLFLHGNNTFRNGRSYAALVGLRVFARKGVECYRLLIGCWERPCV